MQTSILHVGSNPLTAEKHSSSLRFLATMVRAVADHHTSPDGDTFPVVVVSAPLWSITLLKAMCEHAMHGDQPGWAQTLNLFFHRHCALLDTKAVSERAAYQQLVEVCQEIKRELQSFPILVEPAIRATWRIQWWGDYLAVQFTAFALQCQDLPAVQLTSPLTVDTTERFLQPLEIWDDPAHALIVKKAQEDDNLTKGDNRVPHAMPLSISNALAPLLAEHKIPIISGSCIQDTDGRILRLRRDDARLLATVLAEALQTMTISTSPETTEIVHEVKQREEEDGEQMMASPVKKDSSLLCQSQALDHNWWQEIAHVTKDIDNCLWRWPTRPDASAVPLLDWMLVNSLQKRTHQLLERCLQWTQALSLQGLVAVERDVTPSDRENSPFSSDFNQASCSDDALCMTKRFLRE